MRIDLYIDVVSPYSVFGATFLDRCQPIWGYQVNIKPVRLGKVMVSQRNRPPAMTHSKQPWLQEDVKRNSQLFEVDFCGIPANFPGMKLPEGMNPANTDRFTSTLAALIARHGADSPLAMKALRAMQETVFCEHAGKVLHVTDDMISATLQKVGVGKEEAAELLQAEQGEEVQAKLDGNTEEALGLGMFGAPYMAVYKDREHKPECFYGSDSFEQMALVLGKPYKGANAKLGAT